MFFVSSSFSKFNLNNLTNTHSWFFQSKYFKI
jgi:hypothetical protein